ncbi:aminoacyl-tRNA hydrolase [Candidatus Parcubacteria bacterium]|nr:aminoacyl-tRNA hydrolase [Candidatus Parcubacteria bacterium]
MFLIVGLGNPSIKYKNTRHNIGFRIIDEFAKENNFPEFKLSKKHNSLISESIINDNKIMLVKPQTFMNSSGKAIKSIIDYLSLITDNLIVVHDDIDIEIGEIRISENRGSAGHKGVQSIIDEINTKDFARVRVGIKPVGKIQEQGGDTQPIITEKFVLEKFTQDEEKILENIIKQSSVRIMDQTKMG